MTLRVALLLNQVPDTLPGARECLPPGDATSHVNRYEHLARRMAQEPGIEVHVISEHRRMSCAHWAATEGSVTFHFLRRESYSLAPYYLYATGVYRTRRLLRSLAPDLVVGFGTDEPYAWEAVRSGYPAAIMVQGILEKLTPYLDWPSGQLRIARWLEYQALASAAGILVESEFGRDWVASRFPGKRIAVVPNCLRATFAELPIPVGNRTPDLWCVGELSRLKNPLLVLESFAKAARPGAHIHFAGIGPLQGRLERAARELGLADRCHLHGWMETGPLARALSSASGLVLGSWMDSSPNVVVEAHAAGLPVIAASVGGVPSRVRNDVDGFLVPPGDPEAMANAMRVLLDDPARAARMGAAGRERVLREHAPERVARMHLDFYRQLVGRPV